MGVILTPPIYAFDTGQKILFSAFIKNGAILLVACGIRLPCGRHTVTSSRLKYVTLGRNRQFLRRLSVLVEHFDEAVVQAADVESSGSRVDRAEVAVRIDDKVVIKELDLGALIFVLNDAVLRKLAAWDVKFHNTRGPAL